MKNFSIRSFRKEDQRAVVEIWGLCNLLTPANNPALDIKRKCLEDRSLFFVGVLGEKIVATCMAGYDGHRGWLYYLAVHPEFQRRNFGTMIVEHAQESLRIIGCPKIDLMVRDGNHQVIKFYERMGFVREPVTVMGKRLTRDQEYNT